MSEEMCVPETGDVDRIDPAGIPEFTGNLAMLAADCMGFDAAGSRIRTIGSDVHDEFQGLSSFYTAPEAEQLFATTAPARDRAADFADDLTTVRSALWDYHQEITPLVGRLRRLKHEAEEFVASIRDDDDWKQDTARTDRNNQLRDDVAATVARFWAAERSCANRINALWGGPQWTTDDGSGGTRMYGVSEADLTAMEEAPWGRAVEREYPAWRIDQHIKSFVWDGIIVDGIWGGLVGLSSLVGLQGWDAMKASWNGLAQLVVGLSITINPLGHYAVDLMPDGTVKNWLTDAQDLTIETAKGLIAWDTWSEDPARAAGLTTFNVLTTVATFGAGAGVRAAASGASTATRIAATTARIGTAIDVPGHIVTGLTQLNRLSQITDDLARLTAAKGFDLPDGTTQLPNGTVVHPGRPYEIDPPHQATRKPDGTLLLPDGRTLHPDGRLTSPTGDTLQTPDQIPAELSARDRTILDNTTHDPVAVGAPQKPDLNAQAGRDGSSASATAQANPYENGGMSRDLRGEHGHSGEDYSGHSTERPAADQHHGGGGDTGGDANGHGHSYGGGGGGPDGRSPSDPSGGSSEGPGQPMVRGGDEEQRVREAIKGIPGKQRPKPNVLKRVLERLGTEPDGQRLAEIIGSGAFNQSDEYGQVVSALGANKTAMFQPSADQLIFADDLVKSGVPPHAIDFEQKFPVGADMDVRIVDETGDVYAYQMKHLNNPLDPVSEITRGKYLLQLAKSEADHQILLVDGGRGTLAEWTANGSYDALMDIHRGDRGPKGQGITFVIRLEDGNLVIPPGSKLDPKDML
ncbi:hypothetical protein [Streptomyces ginkgonis]|uniref:hypothetical protein n=1 Tax=Streptomyces ginkgonis TaxID=1812259 RepID=UPI002176C1B7|nr:hypothetical protein [Streptomyces ginkgonis]